MKYDYKALYEKQAAFYNGRPRVKRALLYGNYIGTALFFLAYGALVLVAVFKEFEAVELMKILGAPALCLFVVSVLRLAVNRPRPYSEQGAGIAPLQPKMSSKDKSFPSRHIASAFVIGTTFLAYCLPVGIALLALGLALGYARFAIGWHYPSDLACGGILGVSCGLLVFVF